jgi:D-alanyl-D-alanine carboxypeptidase
MKRTRKRNPLAWFFYLIIFLLILILIELVILCVTIVRRGSSQGAQMSQTVQSADAGQHSSMASADDPQQMTQTEIAGLAPQTETDLMQTAITEEATEAQTAAPQANTDLLLILVNASHPLPDNYTVDLVQLANGKQIASLIYPDLQRMFDAARAQGIYPTVTEGYRTHEDQIAMMQNYINRYIAEGYSESDAQQMALDYVAVPGTSEHELGIAADINSQDGNTDWNVYAWLKDNAHNYGFILRYPEGKEDITGIDYEPWHYRYVGEEAAREIYERQITLEEYLMQ